MRPKFGGGGGRWSLEGSDNVRTLGYFLFDGNPKLMFMLGTLLREISLFRLRKAPKILYSQKIVNPLINLLCLFWPINSIQPEVLKLQIQCPASLSQYV